MDTVVFDVDDTLYDQLDPFKKAFQMTFNEYHQVPIQELFVSSRKHSDHLFEASEKGTIPLSELHTYRITAALKEFGIDIVSERALAFQHTYEIEQKQIILNSNIKSLLQYLTEKGTQLAILTNGPSAHQQMKIHKLGLHKWVPKDHIFISESIGFSKPDPRAFQRVEEAIHCNRKTTVYIGDSFENDVVGAKQAGWNSIWVNHRNKTLPDSPFKPDVIVHSTEQLLTLIDTYFD